MATKFKQDIQVDGTLTATTFSGSGIANNLGELNDVSTTGVTSGQILKYNGTSWAPAEDGGGGGGGGGSGDIEGVTAGTGLTGGGTTGTVVLDVDVGTTANKIVQVTATGKYPAIDGSAILNLPTGATQLNGLTDVDTTGVANNKILKYNGTSSKWEIADDASSGGGSLGDLSVTGSTMSSSGTTITLDDNVTVTGTLTSSQAGAPILTSASTLTLQATTRTIIADTPLKLQSFTTTARDALTPADGDIIYNNSSHGFEGFINGSWGSLGSSGGTGNISFSGDTISSSGSVVIIDDPLTVNGEVNLGANNINAQFGNFSGDVSAGVGSTGSLIGDDVRLNVNGSVYFEGTQTNAFQIQLTAINPTADRIINLPDAAGTVITTGNSDTPTTTTSSSDADFVLIDDGGTMKKITPANLGIGGGGGGGSTGDISFSASDISTNADTMNFKVDANNDDNGYEGYYFYGGPTSQGYVRLWTNDAQNETAIKFHVDGTSYYSAMLQRDDQFKMLLNEHGGNIPARIYNMANGTSGHLDLGTRHADGKVRVVDSWTGSLYYALPRATPNSGDVLTASDASGTLAWSAPSGGGGDVVDDTTPQLGGNLDVNGKNITFGDSASASDDRLVFGANTDMQIYHDANDGYNYIKQTAQRLYFQNDDDGLHGPYIIFDHDTTSPTTIDFSTVLAFTSRDTSGGLQQTGQITVSHPEVNANSLKGMMRFDVTGHVGSTSSQGILFLDGKEDEIRIGADINTNGATIAYKFTLGANGSSDYTFSDAGNVWFPTTENDPVLYLRRGEQYVFTNNSGGSHPFEIRVSNGGSAYNTGVTNNGASSGDIIFKVPMSAPATLYYQCQNHSGMGNTINIV